MQFTEAQFALCSGISHIWGVIQNSLEFLYIPLAELLIYCTFWGAVETTVVLTTPLVFKEVGQQRSFTHLYQANRSEKLVLKVTGNECTRAGKKLKLREVDPRTQPPLVGKQLHIMGNHTSLETKTVLVTLQLILLINNQTVYDPELWDQIEVKNKHRSNCTEGRCKAFCALCFTSSKVWTESRFHQSPVTASRSFRSRFLQTPLQAGMGHIIPCQLSQTENRQLQQCVNHHVSSSLYQNQLMESLVHRLLMKNIQEEFNTSVPVFSLKKSLVVTEKTGEGIKKLQICRSKNQTSLLKWYTIR
ncbi:hypothetical protein Anapl_13615 [Anas platyrhynchos]|uniref:Uncharacterized protein n=1 Tax=Anas platyrhynchos TaxID=8839 RepID=R0LSU8_ANAPL|nr:hypothetical protein Anapl_13615 [Anas platyrhynchos]